MNRKPYRDILDSAAADSLARNTDLWPKIADRLERRSLMYALRTRPLVAVLIALFVLLVLSGVAYALGRSLGYIPGYGIVDQNVQMVVLAEPVSQTRDGITITIDEIILTSDKLFITSTTENIPNNLMLPMTDTTTPVCTGNWIYQLPDGSQLNFQIGGGGEAPELFDNGDPSLLSFRGRSHTNLSTPVNIADVTEMKLFIPCVTSDLPAGSLPEDWEFHLKFVPAPEGMTAMTAFPVIEYTPVPADTAAPVDTTGLPEATATLEVNPISITKVIDSGDAYILMGEIAPPPGSVKDYNSELRLVDANGQQISWDLPMDIEVGTPTAQTPFAQAFAMHFSKADAKAMPITLELVAKQWAETPLRFEFDAGENPQPGDEWQIDQLFEVDGHSVTLNAIRVISPQMVSNAGGFQFDLAFSDQDTFATPGIEGFPSMNEGFGGGGGGEEAQSTPGPQWGVDYSVEFASMPKGRVVVTLLVSVLDSEQIWTLPWQP